MSAWGAACATSEAPNGSPPGGGTATIDGGPSAKDGGAPSSDDAGAPTSSELSIRPDGLTLHVSGAPVVQKLEAYSSASRRHGGKRGAKGGGDRRRRRGLRRERRERERLPPSMRSASRSPRTISRTKRSSAGRAPSARPSTPTDGNPSPRARAAESMHVCAGPVSGLPRQRWAVTRSWRMRSNSEYVGFNGPA